MVHLVGGQLPIGHVGDHLADSVNPNDLPNGQNQRGGSKGNREIGGDNNHTLPRGLCKAIRGEVVKGELKGEPKHERLLEKTLL